MSKPKSMAAKAAAQVNDLKATQEYGRGYRAGRYDTAIQIAGLLDEILEGMDSRSVCGPFVAETRRRLEEE